MELENKSGFVTDIKIYLFKILKYWYLIVLVAIIAYLYASIKYKYAVPTYRASAKIAIKDENSSWGQEYFLKGMSLISARNRLINEMGIMKSYNLLYNTVKTMKSLRVSYYRIGEIKTTELYLNSPFRIDYDTLTPKIDNLHLYLSYVDNKHFKLGQNPKNKDQWKTHTFGDTLDIRNNKIVVKQVYFRKQFVHTSDIFSFRINSLSQLAYTFQNKLNIRVTEKTSSLLSLSVAGRSSPKNVDFINHYINEYIKFGLKRKNQTAESTIKFINGQLKELLDSLMGVEQRLENFKVGINEDYITVSTPPEFSQAFTLIKDIQDAKYNISYYDQLINYLQNNDDASGLIIPPFINSSSVLFNLMQGLIDSYNQRMRLSFAVKKGNQNLTQLNNEIQTSKSILIENLKASKEKEILTMKDLQNRLKDFKSRLSRTPVAERKYTNIERENELNSSLYTYLLQKRAEAEMALQGSTSDVVVLNWATPYRVSLVAPHKSSIYLYSFLIAFAILAAIIFLIEFFNDKILEKADIEKITNTPIVGLVGHSTIKGKVMIEKPKGIVAESFRSLRTNLTYLTKGKEKITALVTSSVSGEGKTFTAINLSIAYALLGKKTLLIGADMRKPKIYKSFELKKDKGLSNYLIGESETAEVIQSANIDNLDLISAGPIPPNPSELLASNKMKELLEQLKEFYDIIIIDTPPIGLVTDALMLAPLSDASLYVIRQRFSKKEQIKAITQQYENEEFKNMGIVVNDFEEKTIGYGRYSYRYNYGYGYGYGYGNGYYEEDKEKPKFIRWINRMKRKFKLK